MSDSPRFSLAGVSAPHKAAAAAGRDVLAVGGNALEALVAMAAMLAVALPHRAGLGGDALILVREPRGRTHVIDGTGAAGSAASREAYAKAGYDTPPRRGVKAALTVPGAVAGWHLALDMAQAFGGRLPLGDLLAPAIKLAREGFAATRTAPADLDDLSQQPGFAATFLHEGAWPEKGNLQRAPKLADLLEQLAHAGLRDFYRGDAGREITAELEKLGERIGAPVLRKDYETFEARLRKPLALRMGQDLLLAAPPPSMGLGHVFAVGLQRQLEISWRHEDKMLHVLAESAKRGHQLACGFAIDPKELDEKPETFLQGPIFEREAARLSPDRATALAFAPDIPKALHLAALDANGLTVSCTISMGDEDGPGVVLTRTGLLLNNRGRFFSLDPQAPHVLAPHRKVPFAPPPLLMAQDDGHILAFGSGRADIDAQILARLSAGQTLSHAMDAPRIACGRETHLFHEENFDPTCLRGLEKRGYALSTAHQDFGIAGALLRRRDGSIEGAADPRAEGAVEGF